MRASNRAASDLRDVGEIGDQRNRIAALFTRCEVGPTPVEPVHLERAEPPVRALRVEATTSEPIAFPPGRIRASTAGKLASAARLICGEVDRASSSDGPPQVRQRDDGAGDRQGEAIAPATKTAAKSTSSSIHGLSIGSRLQVSSWPGFLRWRGDRVSLLKAAHFEAPPFNRASRAATGTSRRAPIFRVVSLPSAMSL